MDDPPPASPSENPDDLATLRVAPPARDEIPEDLATVLAAKTMASQTQPSQEVPSLSGANPDAPLPFIFGRRIAKGGMGAILEGDDCKLGRKIAVKVMLDSNASAEQAQRFVQEAAVLGRLEHPNIVPIHDLPFTASGVHAAGPPSSLHRVPRHRKLGELRPAL